MSWLEGVESMQLADWCPTIDQWRIIRQMLNNIKINVPKDVPTVQQAIPGEPVARLVDRPGGPPAAPPPTRASSPPQSRRLVPSALQEQPSSFEGVPAATTTKAGQVLDTSNGQYESEFM